MAMTGRGGASSGEAVSLAAAPARRVRSSQGESEIPAQFAPPGPDRPEQQGQPEDQGNVDDIASEGISQADFRPGGQCGDGRNSQFGGRCRDGRHGGCHQQLRYPQPACNAEDSPEESLAAEARQDHRTTDCCKIAGCWRWHQDRHGDMTSESFEKAIKPGQAVRRLAAKAQAGLAQQVRQIVPRTEKSVATPRVAGYYESFPCN